MASTSKRLLKKRLASAQRTEERAWAEFRSAVAEAYVFLSQTNPGFITEVRDFADEVVKLAQARKVVFPVFVLALAEAGVNVTKWAKERAATLRTTEGHVAEAKLREGPIGTVEADKLAPKEVLP